MASILLQDYKTHPVNQRWDDLLHDYKCYVKAKLAFIIREALYGSLNCGLGETWLHGRLRWELINKRHNDHCKLCKDDPDTLTEDYELDVVVSTRLYTSQSLLN